MEIIALWKWFLRRWWIILIPPVVVLALTFQAFLNPPGGAFQTNVHVTAAQPLAGEEETYEDARYMPWIAAEQLIDALTMWTRTGSFAEEVRLAAGERGVELPANALLGAFAADNTQMVMRVTITWGDPAQLEEIAYAAIDVLQHRSAGYFPPLADLPAAVVALDDPVIAPVGPALLARLQPMGKILAALALGLLLAAAVEYLDDSLRSREDVEALELVVLAEIPRHKGGAKY
jgi:capsular polysaccharide biosynthesis protein